MTWLSTFSKKQELLRIEIEFFHRIENALIVSEVSRINYQDIVWYELL